MPHLDRRRLLRNAFAVTALGGIGPFGSGPSWAADSTPAVFGYLQSLEYWSGRLIDACSLPGETRADGVVPRHANALQLSKDRWLVIYSTHGYRGVDDERSIIYQVRRDAPNGAVIKEGFLSRGREDWFPPDFDKSLLKPNHTHPTE